MLFKSAFFALGSLAVLSEASVINRSPSFSPLIARQRGGGGRNAGNNNAAVGNNKAAAASSTCLQANAVQSGSASTGQANDTPAAGQSNSAT